MTRILIVCLGNICRSPLAEGILQSKLSRKHFIVDSAGTSNYHLGGSPDHRSVAIAEQYVIDITNQIARQFKATAFDAFDYIYAMDRSNFNNIVKLAHHCDDVSKVKLILDELENNSNIDVPDPYYGGEQGFENIYQLLNEACANIANRLTTNSNE